MSGWYGSNTGDYGQIPIGIPDVLANCPYCPYYRGSGSSNGWNSSNGGNYKPQNQERDTNAKKPPCHQRSSGINFT